MASVPSYSTTSGRIRSSDCPPSSSQDEGVRRSETNSSPSTEPSEDNETIYLNRPEATASSSNLPVENRNATDTSNEEPRKCWICYTDETEDSPLNSEWRSPCPCALTAHEECLLDWLADLENPRARRRNGRNAKMVCPQCKSEIMVSRPRSYVVDMVRMLERFAGRLVLPGMVFTLAGTVWAGCCAHGVYSMYFVFGTEEARQIMEEAADGSWNSGLNLGLPLIPLVLIFSRTRYAEGLLPAIPVLFFATHNPGHEPDLEFWPPSAAMTFAALPYVKSFYSALHERLFGKLERKWIVEVQPRQSDINDLNDNAPPEQPELGPLGDDNGQVLMEFGLELQVDDDGIQGDIGFRAGEQEGQGQPNGQDQGAEGNGQALGLGRREDLIHESGNLADIVLGALAFPAISASVGGILKYCLPKSWTTASSTLERGRPGLLQTRWGRSVIGGCVFVLLKDALVLYCRWKLAQTHRRRRVLNYDRTKKQVVDKR
ncbi:hypothetical protein EYZ11_001548 [Aspergillus tanneri]|uniref:RING-CH-type domain-containing protein n=1 Tax=Aspergillus tanneri TaxID=1220188 RepID=A0A4S3JUE4_9EURO|nr:uncharacterized protein ATNIH1004_007577 [Aspergillus tanneri]KAA8646151.1 hypothetical protein ATNIH1004_007577 [Aspergillus tanneri]THC98997.1 hypothetical protein EYZ11_001548 [Aspergillus tanneri]